MANGCGRARTLLYEKLTDVLHHIRECAKCEEWLLELVKVGNCEDPYCVRHEVSAWHIFSDGSRMPVED